ncbi:P-loop containing nucleoside triphosphate hydrolase protein [Pestalotiopsis sp. NC0098]|nr:P-loop containing nucleoside triphosphate hydrolase protein [Pestalotiopsis sp. NC0098]
MELSQEEEGYFDRLLGGGSSKYLDAAPDPIPPPNGTSSEHEQVGDNQPDSQSRQDDLSMPREANTSSVENPNSNSWSDHAAPIQQEQMVDSNGQRQSQQDDLPLSRDEDIIGRANPSDPHQTSAPSTSAEPVFTLNETQPQETPLDDEDSMFVSENFHQEHHKREDQSGSKVVIIKTEPDSKIERPMPLAGEYAGDILMHDSPASSKPDNHSTEAEAEKDAARQDVRALEEKQSKLAHTFETLGLSLPNAKIRDSVVLTGLWKNQKAGSSAEYYARLNKNNALSTENKRKILEQKTTTDEEVGSKKPKTRQRVYDRMQDGFDRANNGSMFSLGKLEFDNPTQARMTRDSISDALEPSADDQNANAQKTFLEVMLPEGTGKTYQAIINILTNPPTQEARNEGRHATLITVPSNVLAQWQAELEHFVKRENFQHYMVYQNDHSGRMSLENQDIIFVSHEKLRRSFFDGAVLKQFESKKTKTDVKARLREEHLGFLWHNKWWRVIIDEAHAIKNTQTKQLWAYLEFLRVPWRGTHADFTDLIDNLHLKANRDKFQAWMSTIMQRRKLGDKFAGNNLYDNPPCFDEVIYVSLPKEEEIIETENIARQEFNQHNEVMLAARVQVKPKKRGPETQTTQNANYMCLTNLNRLRAGTAHPFLLEPAVRSKFAAADIDKTLGKLSKLETHEPVISQLKTSHDRPRPDEYVSDMGDISPFESFGHSGFGGPLEIESYLKRTKAAKFGNACVVCFEKVVDGQMPKCKHVRCQKCFEDEIVQAHQGNRIPKCLACRSDLEGVQSIHKSVHFSKGDIDESERELERLRATLLRARAIPVAKQDFREPKGGQKLGDDIYGRQPQPDEQNTTWLAAADFAYPKPLVPSAKITVIKQLMLNFKKNHPEDKIIIFSQFLETHQIIGRMLQAEGIPFAYFWGGQTADQKNTVIRDFHEKSDFKVLVASLKSGGTGLNITCANRVIITEPGWNAATELQALGRSSRMGQTKTTHFTTLIANNTIDVRIRSLSRDKLMSVEAALQHAKLSREEMASLLGRVLQDAEGNLFLEEDYIE